MSQFVKIIPDNSVKSSAVASSITSATEFKTYFVVHSVFSPRATQKVDIFKQLLNISIPKTVTWNTVHG